MVEWPYQTTFLPRSRAHRAASTASGSTVLIWTAAVSAVHRSVMGTPHWARHAF